MLQNSARNLVVVLLFVAIALVGVISSGNSNSSPLASTNIRQVTQSSRPGQVQVRLFDSVTGYGIEPKAMDAITIRSGLQEQKPQQIKEDNTISLAADQGVYDLTVAVEGYRPMITKISVEEVSTPVEILLDPVETPPEMKEEYINSLTRANVATVIGYLVDEQTGRPLAKAVVSLSNGTLRSKSNKRGFFVLQIPVEESYSKANEPVLKDIRFAKSGYTTEERQYVQAFPGQAMVYRIRLHPGDGINVIDERQHRSNAAAEWDGLPDQTDHPLTSDHNVVDSSNGVTKPEPEEPEASIQTSAVVVPSSIRVGTNCSSRTTCTGPVLTMSLDNYCKRSLSVEWTLSWDMNSLKAGAAAVRSYAAWFVDHPLSRSYDICNNTYCQSFNKDMTNPRSDVAVDETTGVVLVDASDRIVQSEHSRENNNSGCGNCFTGTGTTSPCISDTVCCGDYDARSHGRGMCQRGTQRWATGTKFGGNLPVPSGNEPKDWIWILKHYYPNYRIAGGDFSISTTPITLSIPRGSNATCRVDVQSLKGFSGQVNLSALNLPPGYASAFWTPASSVTVPQGGVATSTLVVLTNSNTSLGTFSITIKAVSGTLVKNKFLQWTITASDSRDEQAKQDMRNRAARDSRFRTALPETFGKDLNWTSDFELRWMAFNFAGNRIVIMNHARSKISGNRFTSFFDPDSQRWTDWQVAN